MKTENQTHLTLKAIDMELKAMLKKDLAKHQKQLNRAANKSAA